MSDRAYQRRDSERPPAGSLFDLAGMHRVPDRETSIAAARSVAGKAGTGRAIALETLRAHPDGLTDEELSRITGIYMNSIGKRRTELTQAGLVRDSGIRRESSRGSRMIVWKATEETT